MKFVKAAALFAMLAWFPSLASAADHMATQQVPTGELQRYIYQAQYPQYCLAANQAARDMRAKSSTDPATMHAIMKANIPECANLQQAQNNLPVFTTAVFAAAAAALIAARHEPPAQAVTDATHARNWGNDLAKLTRNTQYGTPSMYRTNAGRIATDATALLAALNAAPAGDTLPAHVSNPNAYPR